MVEIDSPLGRKSYQQPRRQVFTVEDEGHIQDRSESLTSQPLQAPQTMSEKNFGTRQELLEKQVNYVSPDSRKRVELLTGIGRLYKEATIDGYKFTLKSLKSRESRAAMSKAYANGTTAAMDFNFEVRAQTLARALYKIDDYNIFDVLGVSDIDDVVSFVYDLEENTLELLYSKYLEMTAEFKTKYGVNSKKEGEEVVEEVKK